MKICRRQKWVKAKTRWVLGTLLVKALSPAKEQRKIKTFGALRENAFTATPHLDICRTCKGIGASGEDKEAVFENLAKQLDRLIRTGVNNQGEFEDEHEKLCSDFIDGFHGFEMNYGVNVNEKVSQALMNF